MVIWVLQKLWQSSETGTTGITVGKMWRIFAELVHYVHQETTQEERTGHL